MTSLPSDAFMINQIRCPECGMTCLQKNIYRHMSAIHGWTNDDCKVLIAAIRTEKKGRDAKTTFVCTYCHVIFCTIRHLIQHRKICTAQPEEELELIVEQEEEVVDEFEATSSSFPYPPNRQIPPHHLPPSETVKFPPLPPPTRRANQTKCPECPTAVESIEELIAHCRDRHESDDRKFQIERQLFDTRVDFKKWFDQRQEDTCTSLTKRTGNGGETVYRCHRVGKYQSVAKSRRSNPRKIDQTCTAYLKVFTQGDGSTWVNGCFTHIGHELDHKLLWLTETQQNYVRELLDLGWTSDQIYFYIREEYKNYECKLKYISKNDIRNITVRYNREKSKELKGIVKSEVLEQRKHQSDDNDEQIERKMPRIEETNEQNVESDVIINVVDDEEEEEEPLPVLDKIPV